MFRIRTTILLLLLTFSIQKAKAQHVFFGERSLGDSSSVYFDCLGLPYPDYFISDSSMSNSGSSLSTWYLRHNEDFIRICALYDYFPESINQMTINRLSDSIISRWATSINRQSKTAPALAFYVHGFRKRFAENGQDVTSVTEFGLFREHLKTYNKPEVFAINVYWDGTYDCCFSMNHQRNKELFQLYETAVYQAKNVGIGLRKLLRKTEHSRVQIVGHSLGSQVIASALFNTPETTTPLPTPNVRSRSFHISLIAPAIDAKEFHHYYNRSFPVDSTDVYSLQILYNEDDFALRKKDPKFGIFGPGANRYGKTGLGCNHHHELDQLKKYFVAHFPASTLVTVDKTELGKCHSWRCYTKEQHLKELSDFLWSGWTE